MGEMRRILTVELEPIHEQMKEIERRQQPRRRDKRRNDEG